jgi:hypothetical protein
VIEKFIFNKIVDIKIKIKKFYIYNYMSLFEIGNYVIIDDKYIGKIIKKVWNGYGYIVKLDNHPNYLDNTIEQYQLLNDITDNSDIKGYMLVKANNKMRLINKNNLINLLKMELVKENYVYINNKINDNFLYFKDNILPSLQTEILNSVPVIPITTQTEILNSVPVIPITTQTEILNSVPVIPITTQTEILNSVPVIPITTQTPKIEEMPVEEKITEQITTGDVLNESQQMVGGSKINKQFISIPQMPQQISKQKIELQKKYINNQTVYNPYLGKTDKIINSKIQQKQQIPQLINTYKPHTINNLKEQKGSSKTKLSRIKKMLGIEEKKENPHEKRGIITEFIDIEVETPKEIDVVDKYREEDIKEDDYISYINNMISNLFMSEDEIDYSEIFDDDRLYAKEAENLNILEQGQRINVIKPTIKAVLEKFEPIDTKLYLDLTNTLMYKHIISDNKIDNISFGIQLIKKIKEILINIQQSIKFEDGRKLLEVINLFAYLKFKIAGGYIIIEDEKYDINNMGRIITKKIVPDLTILSSQYNQSINYKILSNIILKNKTTDELKKNRVMVLEALNILAQDYFICLQPKVEYLLWTLTRLILCWYSEPILNENIFKIKILINLYRARGIKEFNKDAGVQPVILIIPKYGKTSALKILSYLSYYFFPYKNVGWKESSPSYFKKVDDLIYYTNGSIDLKKYINYLIKNGNQLISPLSKDFTKIDLPNNTNEIEYKLPSIKK